MYVNFQIIQIKQKRSLYPSSIAVYFLFDSVWSVFFYSFWNHRVWYCFSFIFSRFPPQTFSYQIYVALVRLTVCTLYVCESWLLIQYTGYIYSKAEEKKRWTKDSVKWIEAEKISLFHAMKIEKGQTNKNTYPENPNITNIQWNRLTM